MAQGDRPGKKPFDPVKAEQMKADFIRGAKFAPMDLLGAPVDLTTMAMRGVGIPVPEKPFLGSEYLIDKYADLGEAIDVDYDRPTGSGMETLGRVMAGTAGLGGEAAVALAPGIGKLFAKATKTRGSGTEVKGSGNIEMEASPSDLGPMVLDVEAGADKFVPLEKKVGAPGTPGVERNINPALQEDVFVGDEALGGIDYLPAAQALLENPPGMNIGKKGLTGAQYLARLKNQPSVTDMELEVSGLDKFLAENANRKIPVDDVLDFHMGNSPRIEMVDGGYRHVADQRMFGDESFVMQGKNVGVG